MKPHSVIFLFLLITGFLSSCADNFPAATLTPDARDVIEEVTAPPVPEKETSSQSGNDSPGYIFHNAQVLTMDPSRPEAEAIAILGENILAVGSNAKIRGMAGENTQVIDLEGFTVTPGFIDSHSHKMTQKQNWGFSTISQANQEAISQGWTGLDELFVNEDQLREIVEADKQGQLDIRLNLYLAHNGFAGESYGDWYQKYQTGQQLSPFVRVAGIKIFIDFDSGREFFFNQEELSQLLSELQADGWQVSMKAVSVQSHSLALVAIDYALKGGDNEPYRYRLEHSTAATDKQVAYMAEKKIIPCILPSFPGVYVFEPDIQQIAEENGYENTYRWSDYHEAGVFMVASPLNPHGSYEELYTASHISPMGLLYRSVTQIGPENPQPDPWMIAHTLTVEQLLPLLTINGAYTTFEEDYKGSLEAGKWADLVILSDNPLTVKTDDLLNIETIMTMIGGDVVFCQTGYETLCGRDQDNLSDGSEEPDEISQDDLIVIPAGSAVKIALQGPASGSLANFYPPMENTVRLAINDYGPIRNEFPIELLVFDDQCDQETALPAAVKLLEDYPDLVGVIGPVCSSGGLGALPVFQEHLLSAISGSATKDELSELYGSDVFNRTIYSEGQLVSQGLAEDFLNDTANVLEFINRFETFYKPAPVEVLTYLPYTYDATRLLLEAIEQCGLKDDQGDLVINRRELITEIRRISFEGITGDLSIDGNGNRDTYPAGN